MGIKLSENIKKFRKEKKMTQEQLAEAMGVSVSAVYKWESNQSTPTVTEKPPWTGYYGESRQTTIQFRDFGGYGLR